MNVLEPVRGAFGMVELIQPRPLFSAVSGASAPAEAIIVVRILGARHVLQALMLMRAGRTSHQWGAVVDLSHAVTMIALAAVDRRWRRAAVADAALASTFAALEFR